jgi:hypothetical protein
VSRRNTPGTMSKDKISQTFDFPGIGHRVTFYSNVYHSPAVSYAYFYENVAASLQMLANQYAEKAKKLREQERPEEVAGPFQTEKE